MVIENYHVYNAGFWNYLFNYAFLLWRSETYGNTSVSMYLNDVTVITKVDVLSCLSWVLCFMHLSEANVLIVWFWPSWIILLTNIWTEVNDAYELYHQTDTDFKCQGQYIMTFTNNTSMVKYHISDYEVELYESFNY